MEILKYRRQFLFTPIECDELKNWQIEKVLDHILYVHPDCQLHKASEKNELFLIGQLIDPHNPQKKTRDILIDIAKQYDIAKYPDLLYSLVGRFVLIVKQDFDLIFFNDACGLKTLYYFACEGKVFAASQPLLLKKVINLQKSKNYKEYFESNYVKNNIEHWLPAGISLYQNVFQLIPNHYFRVSENGQTRFYPTKELHKRKYKYLFNEFTSLLQKIITTAHCHMDLYFTLTAGWDSRIILSCCKDMKEEIEFYTLKYRGYDSSHMDIKVPIKLSQYLKLKHQIIDCEKGITEEFANLYKQNTDVAHLYDWGTIAYGMSQAYPENKISVKGNCSEIGRCFYWSTTEHPAIVTVRDILELEDGWSELFFVQKQIQIWFDNLIKYENKYDYEIFDLFYWEHRLGSWQAQSQLEWDIVQEAFCPFNSRELLDIMLAISPKYREKDNPTLYKDAIFHLWKDILAYPINPQGNSNPWRKVTVRILNSIGAKNLFKKLLNKNNK